MPREAASEAALALPGGAFSVIVANLRVSGMEQSDQVRVLLLLSLWSLSFNECRCFQPFSNVPQLALAIAKAETLLQAQLP